VYWKVSLQVGGSPLEDNPVTTFHEFTQFAYNNGLKVKAYPNPFTEYVVIDCYLNEASRLIIDVYNIYGQKITRLSDKMQQAGSVSFYWNGKNSIGNKVSSGYYFCRIQTDDNLVVKKLVYRVGPR
jgi:hypothetical protein